MLGVSVVKPLLPRAEVSVLRHWQEQLSHGRLSWIGVSPPWKTEYPEGCSTAMRRVARKVAAVEGGVRRWHHRGDVVFRIGGTCIWQVYKIDIKYSLHLIYPRSGRASQKSRISDYVLSKNIKDKSEQSLALAYILYLYESYRLYISDWNFGT